MKISFVNYFMPVLLAPFYKAAFEIGFQFRQFIDINIFFKNIIDEQFIDRIVTFIEISSTNHSFKGVTIQMFLKMLVTLLGYEELIQSYFFTDIIQCRSAHYTGTHL